MRTVADEISKQKLYLLSFASGVMLWFFIFCFVTVVVWYNTSSMLIGLVAGIAVPITIIKVSTDKKISFINKALADIHTRTLSSLKVVDYYYYNANGSIAIDTKDQLISFTRVLPTFEILPPIVIQCSRLIHYFYHDPGMVATKYHGNNMAIAQDTINDNIKAAADRAKERGMHFEIDDLQNPKIIINMTAEVADHWKVLLNRIIAQTLEPSGEPKFIP